MSSFSGALAVRPPCCPTLTSQDELVPPESSVNRATDRSLPDPSDVSVVHTVQYSRVGSVYAYFT